MSCDLWVSFSDVQIKFGHVVLGILWRTVWDDLFLRRREGGASRRTQICRSL